MAETLDLNGMLEKDYEESLRRVVASTYGIISGKSSGTVAFDNSEETASHDPVTEITVITEQNVPVALRRQRLLKMVLLQGAAAHEAGHDQTLNRVGEKHDMTGFLEYLKEPFFWPGSKGVPGAAPGVRTLDPRDRTTEAFLVWWPLISTVRQKVYTLTEDLRANSYIEREYARVFWPSLRTTIRYTRLVWAEALRAGIRTALEVAERQPQLVIELSKLAGSTLTGNVRVLGYARKVLEDLGVDWNSPGEEFGAVVRAHAWTLIPEIFNLYYVYYPREIDISRDPAVDLLPDLRQYWQEVMGKFPSTVRCYFPESAEELLDTIKAIRTEGDLNIKRSFGPAKAQDAYRIVVGRFFSQIADLTCWTASPADRKMTTGSGAGGSADQIKAPSPEEKGQPGGGSAARRAGNREEKRMRDRGRSAGDEQADAEARDRGDKGSGGLNPVAKIRKWIREHPSGGFGDAVQKQLDEYLKHRSEASK